MTIECEASNDTVKLCYDSNNLNLLQLQSYRLNDSAVKPGGKDTVLTMRITENDALAALHFLQQYLLDCDRANRTTQGA